MTVDLSKVALSSSANAFKNDGFIYTGSINFPTSLLVGQLSVTTTPINLGELPQFTKFNAYFTEFYDGTYSLGPQWYPANVGGQGSVYLSSSSGPLNGAIYPVILANTVLVTASVFNPYAGNVTVTALNVPFAFVEYTLAN